MRIGIDITILAVAQAGVFYYRYHLIRALLALNAGRHGITLVDYHPIHGGWRSFPILDGLNGQGARRLRINGLRHRQLARLAWLQKPGLWPLARAADRLLLWPYGRLAQAVMARQLSSQLAGLDVFHTSDVLNFSVPGARSVVTVHDLTAVLFPGYHTAGTRELQAQKLRFAQAEADAVICVSHNTRQDVIRHLGIQPARTHVVYEGVEDRFRPLPAEAIAPILARHGLTAGGYILHVGTLEPRKNLVRLLEAYRSLRRENPVAPKLVLAGRQGWAADEILAALRAPDLAGHVHWLGPAASDDLPALYNGAVMLVLPSLYEGFGLPALEAMACGRPVIASNLSSLPEVVGDAGLLVDPADSQAIAAAMQALLARPDWQAELGRAGRKRAQAFTWQRAAEETLAIYTALAAA
ncbi:MAG: glycosyltransferase family 4 protein [Candidatus Promineifilaceae bacterium]